MKDKLLVDKLLVDKLLVDKLLKVLLVKAHIMRAHTEQASQTWKCLYRFKILIHWMSLLMSLNLTTSNFGTTQLQVS